ncbi:MAG: hypothetical protein K0R67_528 [Paenibacillus sp.]|jgi:FkbM family methyltransferase|nr:hypothetical protein [Paenibacillus sp.]
MKNLRKVKIRGTSNHLYIDQTDLRGKSLVTREGVSQKKLTSFWLNAVSQWKPELVLDIGVNYGEVILAPLYDKHTKIIGVEANPKFKPYLDLAMLEHPNGKQMKMIYALASDREEKEQDFYIHKTWSGNSTAGDSGINREKNFKVTKTESITIDALTSNKITAKERILFKIDVEGFEAHVMRGMKNLLKTSEECIGFIEFGPKMLSNCGTDPNPFLADLDRQFDVYAFISEGKLHKFKSLQMSSFNQYFKDPNFRTDLLLVRSKKFLKHSGLEISREE